MKTISSAMLQTACGDHRAEFIKRFPDGVTFKSERDAVRQCVAVADVFDWDWAAENLLNEVAWNTYEEAHTLLLKAYKDGRMLFLKTYSDARAALWKTYNKACTPLRKTHDESRAALWKTYEEAIAPWVKTYNKAHATEFAKAFWAMPEGEI